MDRNVFALIAGTVFLLFIINAVIQMQTAMVREAAGGIGDDFSESTYETAGLMHVLSHDDTTTFGYFPNRGDLNEDVVVEDRTVCSLEGNSGFRSNDGPLRIDGLHNAFEKETDCLPGGKMRSAPIRIEDSQIGYVAVERYD